MCACWGFLYPFLQGKEEEKDHKKKGDGFFSVFGYCSSEWRKKEREREIAAQAFTQALKKKKGVTKCQKMREEKKKKQFKQGGKRKVTGFEFKTSTLNEERILGKERARGDC